MNFKSGKPIVRFIDDVNNWIVLDQRADVYALDHPRLGRQDVSTSKVLEIFYANGIIQAFETLNTIYVLDTYKIPE